jgi:hypothetical protein
MTMRMVGPVEAGAQLYQSNLAAMLVPLCPQRFNRGWRSLGIRNNSGAMLISGFHVPGFRQV